MASVVRLDHRRIRLVGELVGNGELAVVDLEHLPERAATRRSFEDSDLVAAPEDIDCDTRGREVAVAAIIASAVVVY